MRFLSLLFVWHVRNINEKGENKIYTDNVDVFYVVIN